MKLYKVSLIHKPSNSVHVAQRFFTRRSANKCATSWKRLYGRDMFQVTVERMPVKF